MERISVNNLIDILLSIAFSYKDKIEFISYLLQVININLFDHVKYFPFLKFSQSNSIKIINYTQILINSIVFINLINKYFSKFPKIKKILMLILILTHS